MKNINNPAFAFVLFQLFFAMDRVKELASQHPEWKDEQPFKAVLENDMKALVKSGDQTS
ncbi:MAG: hypothetical protein K8R53_08170 [Bacteroidales bacterium]|nr:hypothetical protein [Bacteroidales bacterium]